MVEWLFTEAADGFTMIASRPDLPSLVAVEGADGCPHLVPPQRRLMRPAPALRTKRAAHLSVLSLEIGRPEEKCFPRDRRTYGLRCRDLVGRWSNALASTPKAFASLSTMSIVALYSERSSALT